MFVIRSNIHYGAYAVGLYKIGNLNYNIVGDMFSIFNKSSVK